jgi:hypothetical protein
VVRPWQLYDNQRDPYQLDNLIDDPQYREVCQALSRMLDAWLELVGESFTERQIR